MNGNERNVLVVQERDRRLLRELGVLRVADREQIGIVAGFHSTTRANVRLLRLTQAGLLRRFFLGTTGKKSLYALSAKGAELVQVPLRGPRRRQDEILVADYFIEHQLAVNRLYCNLKFSPIPIAGVTFAVWKSFGKALADGLRLIPDGYVEFVTPAGQAAAFLEVDLGHESLRIWQGKIRNYKQLAIPGEYQRRFAKTPFRVCVIAHSERRMHSIRREVAKLTDKLFWLTSLDQIERSGFFGPIWFRPLEHQPKGFMEHQ